MSELDIDNLIRIERVPRKSGGPRIILVLKCSHENCDSEIRVRKPEYGKSTLKCKVHSHVKAPFYSIYNCFKNDHRKLENTVTFEDFLNYTKTKECHYCNSNINWIEYGTVAGKYLSRAYYLDRMDNSKGYVLDNIVVCCTKCNRSRGDKYTYKEWLIMTKPWRDGILPLDTTEDL